ncbi:MAG: hypothetical protein IJS08_14235, partial [Victivallales bacterium]|nr:hypothetical protein [Victivallales bacterium]
MTLDVNTVHTLERRRGELSNETVHADYSRTSMKAIKEHILTNFGFWSKTRVSRALGNEHAAGHDTMARMGAALSRKPMGPEGAGVLQILAKVNGKSLGVMNALSEIGKLERQYVTTHAPDLSARAFFATARKIVLMAPMVDQHIPANMTQAAQAVTDISTQFEQMEQAFNADTLQEVDRMRSLYDSKLQLAIQTGNSEMADAAQLIMAVLDSKKAMLQELANISTRLNSGIPDARTMQDVGNALETMAHACLVSYGSPGELHDLGRASLIGAVQNGMKEFYGVMHRRDMARIAALQAQIDMIDFSNKLTVDWTSVDGLIDEVSSLDDKVYSQEMLDEGAAALQKLNKSAQMKSLLVRLRTLENDFNEEKSVGNASLTAILHDAGAMEIPAHETNTYERIKRHAQALMNAMNKQSADRVLAPLAALSKELEAAKSVEQARDCGRRIEAELKTQLDFLMAPEAPVFPNMLEKLRKKLNEMSTAAIIKEWDLVMASIDAGEQHTLQELYDSLASQEHMNKETVQSSLNQLKDISQDNHKSATRTLETLGKQVRDFDYGTRPQAKDLFGKLQTLSGNISAVRSASERTMLANEQKSISDKCGELEAGLATNYAEAMTLLPSETRLTLDKAGKRAVGELCRLGGFDAKLALAILKLGQDKPGALRHLNDAVNARLDGKPGATTALFAQLDTLLETDPEVADALLQIKLKLASGMDEKKVRLLHQAAVARTKFDRAMEEPSKNLSMERLGLYYFKGSTPKSSLRYMLGKIGTAGRNRPVGLNMAILKNLWLDELTSDITDDSPLPDVKARFAEFQAKLPEPFKSDTKLFDAMAFDVEELRFVEDFGKALAELSGTMDGARELQSAFDTLAGQDDIFAARKALESLTRRYANCTSATGDQLMESGTGVRQGLFAACEQLPDELATAFQIDGEPTEEQQKAIEAFAEKAEGLRSTSVLLTTRAKRQQAACAAIVGDVADMDRTIRAVKEVDGQTFKPGKVNGASVAVCILALQTAVKGMERDMNLEMHAPKEADRKKAAQRMQLRYNLLAYVTFPDGMHLSSMSSRFKFLMDEEASKLFALRHQIFTSLPEDPTAAKEKLNRIAKEIESFLAAGNYVEKAKAVLAYKHHDSQGTAQVVWDSAFENVKLSGKRFTAERDMIFDMFPQELAGKAVRAAKAQSKLSAAAKEDFAAAKKSLDETTQAFSGQVRKALSDAVRIAVVDTFLRSDPPIGSAKALRQQISNLPNQRALREMPFFQQCQKTLREKLAVPDAVSTNLLIQLLTNIDDRMFQNMAKSVSTQGTQTFLMDLSAADRAPIERLLHHEDTLHRATALISSMKEPDAMVTFDLGMTHGSTVPSVAGHASPGSSRR